MNNSTKVKQWAKEHGYCIFDDVGIMELTKKCYEWGRFKEDFIMQCINIIVQDNNKFFISSANIETSSNQFYDKQQLEDLFIPFNNVKKDVESLKEYIQ